MAQEVTLTQKEAVERLLNRDHLENVIINGIRIPNWKTDYAVMMRKIICAGNITLDGAVINGDVYIGKAVISGSLYLDGAEIEGNLTLSGISIGGNLGLGNASIKGNLYLNGATIKGVIKLATKRGPSMIFVSPDMAELVHWSAPTIPLVVVK